MNRIKEISNVLDGCEKVTYWSILGSKGSGDVFYLVLGIPSQVISSEEEKHKITVYNVHENNNLGESSQDIIGDAGKSTNYSSIINGLVEKAEGQKNPIFEFPSAGGSYVKVPLSDPEISDASVKEIEKKIKLLSEEMNDIAHEKGFSIPRIEVYVNRGDCCFLSKSGIYLTEPETKMTLEFEILYNKNGHKGSYAPMVSCRRFKDLSPKNLIEMYAPYAEFSALAEKTISHKGSVVITGDALLDLFRIPEEIIFKNPLYFHSSAQMKYTGQSSFDLGKNICKGDIKGEKITIVSDPHIPFGIKSESFSPDDGLPTMEFPLVKENEFKNFHGNKRFSDYLGSERRGPVGNIIISPGESGFSDLLETGVPVIEAFSGFQPDETGNLGLEIRVGYVFKDGEKIPIKGGLLMGKYFEMLSNMHLSKEILVSTGYGYKGPQAIRFENLEICER